MTGRQGGVTEQAAVAAIEQGCRMLRLPTIRERFGEIAGSAQREQLTYLGFHSECTRTSTSSCPATSPMTKARCCSPSSTDSYT